MQFWNEMEGQTIDGLFPLRRLDRVEGRRAWFETTTAAPESSPAILSLSESLTDADEIESRLRAAGRLGNPNLVAISRIGRVRVEQTLLVYALMEYADQDLEGLLRSRPLTAAEVRQVARVLIDALTAIHGQNLFHGRMEPASVLAIGDAVKLRSDCLESPGGSQAGDIAGLGEIVFQAFTQRKPSSTADPEIDRLPAPFAGIVRNALSGNWNLRQINNALDPPAPARPAEVTGSESRGLPPTSRKAEPASASLPAQAHRVSIRADRFDDDEPNPRRRSTIYTVVAILVAIFIVWLIARPKAHREPAPAAPQASHNDPAGHTSQLSGGKSSKTAGLAVKVRGANGQTRAHAAARTAVREPTGSSPERNIWHVVAYTYHQQDEAQHSADRINKAHPGLHARVFSPHRGRSPYLVIVGGSMNRDQAFAMRRKVRSLGLPRDSYAQNFSH